MNYHKKATINNHLYHTKNPNTFFIKNSSHNNNHYAYINGYASIFNNIDEQQELISYGAYSQFLQDNNSTIPILWQHKHDEPIGKVISIKEEHKGLFITGAIDLRIKRGLEAQQLVQSNIIQGLSIGYIINDYEYDYHNSIKILNEITIKEISIVTFPANQEALITNTQKSFSKDQMTISDEINFTLDNMIKTINNK